MFRQKALVVSRQPVALRSKAVVEAGFSADIVKIDITVLADAQLGTAGPERYRF